MKEAFSWTKLTDKERLDYGVWIAVCAMSVVVSALFGVIINLNNERKELQNKIPKDVESYRKRDSIEIQFWKIKHENLEKKYINSLEQNTVNYKQLKQKTDSLNFKINEKK